MNHLDLDIKIDKIDNGYIVKARSIDENVCEEFKIEAFYTEDDLEKAIMDIFKQAKDIRIKRETNF